MGRGGLHPPAFAPSPQPLEAGVIALYRGAMTRCRPADWDALRQRVDHAAALGELAFGARDRSAWEVAQLVQWSLHRRGSSRPSEPGDVLVLDALARAEEARLPAFAPPDLPADPRVFCERLAADVRAAAIAAPDPIARMCAASLRDWRYIAHNMLAEAWDFTRLIALASVSLPHRFARLMYHNLHDEVGRGDWQRAHFKLFADFAGWLDIPVPGFDIGDDDDGALLDWSAPEVIAEINAHKRVLRHARPQFALGAMFVVEYLVPSDFAALVKALRALGVPGEKLAYFEEHVEVDGGHADDWMAVVGAFAGTDDDRRVLHASAIESARWFALGWEGLCRGLDEWKRTGDPPRLPARELRGRERT